MQISIAACNASLNTIYKRGPWIMENTNKLDLNDENTQLALDLLVKFTPDQIDRLLKAASAFKSGNSLGKLNLAIQNT